MSELTDEQLRVRVAELMGYRWWVPICTRMTIVGKFSYEDVRPESKIGALWDDRPRFSTEEYYDWEKALTVDWEESTVPNYPADLNACHGFENQIGFFSKQPLCDKYELALAELCYQEGLRRAMWHATPRQRCIAFIQVMEATE